MSKLKTRRSADKRYRKTKNGKFIFKRPFKSHILEKNRQNNDNICPLWELLQKVMLKV